MNPEDEPLEEQNQHPQQVPPAADYPYSEAPAGETYSEEVYDYTQQPVEEGYTEQVYDYTQGTEEPQIYEQHNPPVPSIDPYAEQQQYVSAPPPINVPPPSAAPAPITRPRGAPPRRGRTVKRQGGAPAARPGYRGRPGQPKYAPPVGSGFSVMTVLTMIIAIGLLILAVMVMSPTKLNHIKGYSGGAETLEKKEPRNLLAEAQQLMLNNGKVSYTEEEVNQYLAGRLKGTQTGVFGSMMKVKGVCVDFQPDVAEVFIERSFFGIPVTMSSRVKINTFGNSSSWISSGGRIGKLDLSGEKQFGPVLQTFLRLAKICSEEVTVIDSASKVKFESDKIALDYD